jgi:hypothetical protein
MSSRTAPLQYIRIRKVSSPALVEFDDPREFKGYLEARGLRAVLRGPGYFAFELSGALAILPDKDFDTLESFTGAIDFGFTAQNVSAGAYESALSAGYDDAQELELAKMCGITDREIFLTVRERGYIEDFDKLNQLLGGRIRNVREIYELAEKNGFRDAKHMHAVLSRGIGDARSLQLAEEGGFPDNASVQEAQRLGVSSFPQLQKARGIGCRLKGELDKYEELAHVYGEWPTPNDGTTREIDPMEALVYKVARETSSGQPLAFAKLLEKVTSAAGAIAQELGGWPAWLKRDSLNSSGMENLITTGTFLRLRVRLNHSSDTVLVRPANRPKVLVDASNVARYSPNENGVKVGSIHNLRLVDEELCGLGYDDITYYSDANLDFHIDNGNELDAFKRGHKWVTVPGGTEADSWIIEVLKEEVSVLVSNDRFRDHTVDDADLAVLVDRARVPFVITDGKVRFDGLT